MSTSCYDAAPEFIDEDNRRFRSENPISRQLMAARHGVLLPEGLVRGKTVLDLGCCLGATGHWALSHGATHYTGVELQAGYAEAAQRLLQRYHPGKFTLHQMAIEPWLAKAPPKPAYDIVCLLGVLYVFTDYYSILKSSTALARDHVVVDSVHIGLPHPHLMRQFPDFCGVVFNAEQHINSATENGNILGRGARFSPKGLEFIMEDFGFKSKDGVLFPPPITDVPDVYNRSLDKIKMDVPVRYLMRFDRVAQKAASLSEDMQEGRGTKVPWSLF
jgi:hypothetical protein